MSTVAPHPDERAGLPLVDAPPPKLRAEHDALAARLEARRSIDHFRAAAIVGFVAFLAFGVTGKLAWDRWGPPPPGLVKVIPPGGPMFFLIALVVSVVLLAFAARSYRRYARLAAEEAALFARLKALRDALGLEG